MQITNYRHKDAIENAIHLVSEIGILNLLFFWNLVLVYWCFVTK